MICDLMKGEIWTEMHIYTHHIYPPHIHTETIPYDDKGRDQSDAAEGKKAKNASDCQQTTRNWTEAWNSFSLPALRGSQPSHHAGP